MSFDSTFARPDGSRSNGINTDAFCMQPGIAGVLGHSRLHRFWRVGLSRDSIGLTPDEVTRPEHHTKPVRITAPKAETIRGRSRWHELLCKSLGSST